MPGMTYDPGNYYEPRSDLAGQPAAPLDQPTAPTPPYQPPYPPTAYLPAQYPPPQVVVVQAPPQRPTAGMATASMVLGIVGLTVCLCFTFGIPSILAIIFGHLALNDINKTGKGGHGQALAGLITGYIGVAPAVVLTIMTLFGGLISAVTPTPTATP